ncbi:hypothetical protein ABIE08_004148 [Kaistia defluvii]|jgi:hypothetical protein|uniref:Uncharacterized protein n=1 Tax=Kaistia defluvii TaxID=410841 RepID=A0ABV2R6B4_9HYPH
MSFDEIPMTTIIEMIGAIHASDRADWLAFFCTPLCIGALGLFAYGWAA